ncbi:ABC transporter ATP-binding protein [Streptomyces sp. NPDC088923]|uniref:ABC transporter ATP-binding protein n=1 Tax=Streptomyces sp. NPDC088923 TaxID=3365913 RepID=UPI0037FEA6A2
MRAEGAGRGGGGERERVTSADGLRVQGLTLGPASGGESVLTEASLVLGAGRILGVVGRSGSGKSSLALALLGHVRPGLALRAGRVRVAGTDPFTRQGARLVRGRLVAYVGQDPAAALNPARGIGAHLLDAVRRAGGPREKEAERVATLLDRVRLPAARAFLRRRPHEVSGGQARRVVLAAALASAPRVLVLDEPTAGLDDALAREVRELIEETVREEGRSVVLVSHDPRWVGALADEAVRLEAGRVVARGTPREVLATDPAPPRRRRAAEAGREGGLRASGLVVVPARGAAPVLRGVGLAVPPGTCTAVLGPSGAGKTTLARCLAGLLAPEAGTVEWHDREGVGQGPSAAAQLVAQDAHGALNPRESVRRALTRPLTGLRGFGPDRAAAEAGALLARVGLGAEILARRPAALSGGERQRVALARALAAAPRVLVCDEVTSALDPDTATEIVDLLDALRRRDGLTLVLVSHDLAAVARCADRVVVLDGGEVVASGAASQVLGQPPYAVPKPARGQEPSRRGRATRGEEQE